MNIPFKTGDIIRDKVYMPLACGEPNVYYAYIVCSVNGTIVSMMNINGFINHVDMGFGGLYTYEKIGHIPFIPKELMANCIPEWR